MCMVHCDSFPWFQYDVVLGAFLKKPYTCYSEIN